MGRGIDERIARAVARKDGRCLRSSSSPETESKVKGWEVEERMGRKEEGRRVGATVAGGVEWRVETERERE